MIAFGNSIARRFRDRQVSLIAGALLLAIGFGATAGLVHRHGPVAPQQTVGLASSVNELPHSSDSGHTQAFNCPLCQFHHQLFNGAGEPPVLVFTPALEYTPVITVSVITSLGAIPRTRGRAPPAVQA
jgi:hypothetical protein